MILIYLVLQQWGIVSGKVLTSGMTSRIKLILWQVKMKTSDKLQSYHFVSPFISEALSVLFSIAWRERIL